MAPSPRRRAGWPRGGTSRPSGAVGLRARASASSGRGGVGRGERERERERLPLRTDAAPAQDASAPTRPIKCGGRGRSGGVRGRTRVRGSRGRGADSVEGACCASHPAEPAPPPFSANSPHLPPRPCPSTGPSPAVACEPVSACQDASGHGRRPAHRTSGSPGSSRSRWTRRPSSAPSGFGRRSYFGRRRGTSASATVTS